MSAAALYDQTGARIGEVELAEAVFSRKPHTAVLHEALVWQLARRRRGTHSTLTRGMVDRTTRKLYRQKGTGRARHGARGAPIFVGGGIAHGPHPRSYAYRLPKKVRHLAMRSALSAKAAEGRIAVIVQLDLERPKTGPLARLLRAVGGDVRQRSESHRTESVLLVTAAPHQATERSAANLRGVRVAPAASLNVHDVLRADLLMFTREALEKVTEALSA